MNTFIPNLELIEVLELLGYSLNIIHSSPLHYGVLGCGKQHNNGGNVEAYSAGKIRTGRRETSEHTLYRLVGLNSCFVHLLHGCVTGQIFASSAHVGQGCEEPQAVRFGISVPWL
jgi:hypothetical protein